MEGPGLWWAGARGQPAKPHVPLLKQTRLVGGFRPQGALRPFGGMGAQLNFRRWLVGNSEGTTVEPGPGMQWSPASPTMGPYIRVLCA